MLDLNFTSGQVVLVDIDESKLVAMCEEIKQETGGEVVSVVADVAKVRSRLLMLDLESPGSFHLYSSKYLLLSRCISYIPRSLYPLYICFVFNVLHSFMLRLLLFLLV